MIKRVKPLTVYSKRRILPSQDIDVPLLESAWNDIMATNVHKIGPSMTIYHQSEYKERNIDMEAAIPVAPDCGLETCELPAAIEKAACLVYYGSYEGLNSAYNDLARWIEDNRCWMNGRCRTLFLTCGEHGEDP